MLTSLSRFADSLEAFVADLPEGSEALTEATYKLVMALGSPEARHGSDMWFRYAEGNKVNLYIFVDKTKSILHDAGTVEELSKFRDMSEMELVHYSDSTLVMMEGNRFFGFTIVL